MRSEGRDRGNCAGNGGWCVGKMTFAYVFLVGVACYVIMVIRRYVSGGVCRSRALLTGKTAIVTGANSGIGKQAARELALREARVILACRNIDEGQAAAREMREDTGGDVVARQLDLASLDSVRRFCAAVRREERRLDVLVNNAGVFYCPLTRTRDGFEMHMGVNHFGHFLLTNLLLDLLVRNSSSRIVVVSSIFYKRGAIDFENINSERSYSRFGAYANSKLANALFARELARKLAATGTNVYCVHPGLVITNIDRHIPSIVKICFGPMRKMFLKTPQAGCQTTLHCAVTEELGNESGFYYSDCKKVPWEGPATDDALARKLWEVSEKLTGLV